MSITTKIKDRKMHIECLRMALNMVGIGVNYESTILLDRIVRATDKMGGEFSVKDAVEIQAQFEKEMDEYFKKQKR
jgi:hypothetical protein